MRTTVLAALSLTILATPALAAAQEEGHSTDLLAPSGGLMFWTLLIFVGLLVILTRFAFKPLIAAVEDRERMLEEAIAGAKRDREAAARALAEQQAEIEGARNEAQRLIAEGRAVAEKMRTELLEDGRAQQQDMLERARREINAERERAVLQLRREAVELAIAGASKVIEKNLDGDTNRKLVQEFLTSVAESKAAAGKR
jgi:F-type H+-transporting ATPase subunit b